ncbi:hypothetical protein B7486_68360, partial [cyanobacterium TDX16]
SFVTGGHQARRHEPGARPMKKIRKAIVGGAALGVFGLGSLAGTAFALGQFSDVPESHPFYADIEWMAETGISEGYPDGTYRPGDPVTRQAMSAFVHRANSQEIVQNGALFTSETSAEMVAECPEGTQVISGGGSSTGTAVVLHDSAPLADGSGWRASFRADDAVAVNFAATAYAVCGPVDNVD